MPEPRRRRRFARKKLKKTLPPHVFEALVQQTEEFLKRRFKFLADEFDNIGKTNFNPFLLLITAPVYNMFSPFEVAERLQLAKAFHGDDTAHGRMGEEKYLPLFGTLKPTEKKGEIWEPIDIEVNVEGQRYLMSIKSGPWTVNQSHANAMIQRFPQIHDQTGLNIVLGIMYGRYENLNNKPELVARSLNNPDWFELLVGKDFWEFVSGVKDVHIQIFKAIRTAQKNFAD